MSKVTMPEPVAWREWDGEYRIWEYHDADDLPVNFRPANGQFLITTDQAEAYAAAKVREALEQAATLAEQHPNAYSHCQVSAHASDMTAVAIGKAIRALIPTDPRPGQP